MKNFRGHWCRFIAMHIFLVIFTAAKSNAQSTPKQALLALSKANHTLAIVDPATLKIIAKIPVGEDPHEY